MTTTPKKPAIDIRAYRFFFEHAGWIVGRKAECALQMARAEQWALDNNVSFDWQADDTTDYSFFCWNATNHYSEWCNAVLHCECCKDGEKDSQSLGGIIDADTNYRPVIEAELAVQLMDRN